MIVTVADDKTSTQIDIKKDECVFFKKIKIYDIEKIKQVTKEFEVIDSS